MYCILVSRLAIITLIDSPDMMIFSKYNVMCWPKIRSFVSGVLNDFNAFLRVIFGNFILMVAVLLDGRDIL